MVTDNHYRWDFIGLSTDVKPTPQTSEKVVDGSTFYCSDTSKLYVFCNNTWYERKPLGGGGGGTTYTAGEGITIDDDTISADLEVLQTKVVTVLTDDDANYTDNDSNEYVALWLLPNGKYTMAEDMNVPILPALNADGDPMDARSADTQPLVLICNLGEGDYADISVLDSNGIWNHYVVEYDTGIFNSNDTAFPTVFNGTNGTANGTEGLVPAPTTSDAGKFLKADGTWATAGGGSAITTLTTADYNYPTDNPNRIALPLLDEGFYVAESDVYVQEDANRTGREYKLYYVSNVDAQGYNYIWVFDPKASATSASAYPIYYYVGNPSNGNLTSKKTIMSEEYYLYYYGLIRGTSAPTSTTTAQSVGQMYIDSTTQKVYMCTDTTGGTYTWKEISLT